MQQREVLLSHMEEMFDQLDQDHDSKISILLLPELVHLMSEDIGKQELLYLAKECSKV
jgi:Ca2+-binding EF-hand superfamily protein